MSSLSHYLKCLEASSWVLNPMPAKTPVDEYLDLQGRFKGLTEEGRAEFQEWVDMEWDKVEKKSELQPAGEPALYV